MLLGIQDAGDGLEGEDLLPVSAASACTTQRVPLPQACAFEPSELRISIQASVPSALGSWIAMIWSNWVSDRHSSAIAAAGVTLSAAAAHVDDQDLVAKPVHLREFDRCAHGNHSVRLRLYMAEMRGNYQWVRDTANSPSKPRRLKFHNGWTAFIFKSDRNYLALFLR